MQWNKAEKIFAEEPWLLGAMGEHNFGEIEDQSKLAKARRRWVERVVKHIVFHPFEALDPKWRPQFRGATVETTEDWSDACDRNMRQWMDTVRTVIRYTILYRLDGEDQLRADFVTEGGEEIPTVAEYLNQMIDQWGDAGQKRWDKPGRQVKFYLAMRLIKVSSEKYGTLYACFDLYRFPPGFRLNEGGWVVLQKV